MNEMTEINAIIEHIQADYGPTPMSEMAALLAFIQAEACVHQSHHWRTRGESYYGDHLLFERIYNGVYGNIDKIAERMIGSGHHILAHPILLAKNCSLVVQSFYRDAGANPSSDTYPALSLRTCLRTILALKIVYAGLEKKGQLSYGTDNLLQGIADEHEGYVYLLKQRTQAKTANYDRRSSEAISAAGFGLGDASLRNVENWLLHADIKERDTLQSVFDKLKESGLPHLPEDEVLKQWVQDWAQQNKWLKLKGHLSTTPP